MVVDLLAWKYVKRTITKPMPIFIKTFYKLLEWKHSRNKTYILLQIADNICDLSR